MKRPRFDREPLLRHWGRKFVLEGAPLVYRARSGRDYAVPAGFVSDLDSRPKWLPMLFRVLMASQIAATRPALLHDWLYQSGAVPKRRADWLFWEALRADGDSRLSAFLFWAGVALGGHWAWWQCRRASRRRARQ